MEFYDEWFQKLKKNTIEICKEYEEMKYLEKYPQQFCNSQKAHNKTKLEQFQEIFQKNKTKRCIWRVSVSGSHTVRSYLRKHRNILEVRRRDGKKG